MKKKSIIVLFIGLVMVLSACNQIGSNSSEEPATNSTAILSSTESGSADLSRGITSELLSEYKTKHHASVAVIDMLIPQQALILGDESIVKLLVLEGITGETVIPRDSIARIEKTEIPGVGMVTVKIVDRTGKEISVTLTPEDAATVSE